MTRNENVSYFRFFQEELYPHFTSFLLKRMSAGTLADMVGGYGIFTRGGVHFKLRRQFSLFLETRPDILKVYKNNGYRCMALKNICGEPLATPVDTADDSFMVREGLRVPIFRPGRDRKGRVWLATGYR